MTPALSAAGATLAIRIHSLNASRGRQPILSQIDLDLAAGGRLALVGVNGAGKTTLIKCVLDLRRAQQGTIEIFGGSSTRPESRRRLTYVPERFVPPQFLRCGEFLALAASLRDEVLDRVAAREMLGLLDLPADTLDRPVRELSKGMTQKLGLAAAFLGAGDLLVLDEPMSGLDPAARAAVKSAMLAAHVRGRTLFFTSHVLADVEALGAEIAILDQGRLRFRGSIEALRKSAGDEGLEGAFLATIRQPDPRDSSRPSDSTRLPSA